MLAGPRLSVGVYQITALVQFRNTGGATTIACSLGGPTWTHALPTGDSLLTLEASLDLDATTTVGVTCMAMPAGVTVTQYAIDALQVGSIH